MGSEVVVPVEAVGAVNRPRHPMRVTVAIVFKVLPSHRWRCNQQQSCGRADQCEICHGLFSFCLGKDDVSNHCKPAVCFSDGTSPSPRPELGSASLLEEIWALAWYFLTWFDQGMLATNCLFAVVGCCKILLWRTDETIGRWYRQHFRITRSGWLRGIPKPRRLDRQE